MIGMADDLAPPLDSGSQLSLPVCLPLGGPLQYPHHGPPRRKNHLDLCPGLAGGTRCYQPARDSLVLGDADDHRRPGFCDAHAHLRGFGVGDLGALFESG
jgi:hypothetical protein